MSDEITPLSTRIVYQNRWMRVREDTVRRSDGSEGLYGVVEKPDYAVIAAVENARIHLVQQYRYPVKGRYWELPQGSWEDSPNVDPVVLARAELQEETGLVAESVKEVGHLFQAYGYSNQGFHVFLATQLRQASADRDAEELDLITRDFALADLEEMIISGTIKDATTIAAIGLLKLKGLL